MNNSVAKDLTRSLKMDGINLGGDIGEAFIDTVMSEGVLKEVPIVKSLMAVYSAGVSIQKRRYIKNLLIFLRECESFDLQRRNEALEQYLSTEEKREQFGETMLLLIERADENSKPELYAKLIELWIRGECDYADAIRCCKIVDKSFYEDLMDLSTFSHFDSDRGYVVDELYKNGLLAFDGIDGGQQGNRYTSHQSLKYKKTKYGEIIKKAMQILNNAN
ncbi:MAG: hypothetical protein L3K52_00210 [Candidatus Thiothrix sulfatifontis]|nr:MAG: hypothetical protein L3K52_00210 [Candidatus Thiothrix sulfatifontis]